MKPVIASIVEGQGDVSSVQKLIWRIAALETPGWLFQTPRSIWSPRSTLLRPGGLEHYVDLAAKHGGGILILIDADKDCPRHLGAELLKRAQVARSDLPLGIVLAKHEYEAWFLAAAESLRGLNDLPDGFSRPENPEGIRGAKEHMEKFMRRKYRVKSDQPEFTKRFDLDQAHHYSRSFRKCYKEVKRLLQEVQGKAAT